MTSQFYVGQRRSYDGSLCTVRYTGEVKGTKGEWLGVEWDDGSRGKHAGQHAGVEYFTCASRQATPASFIRPTRPSDPPRDFVEAVKHKYASDFGAHGVYSVHGFQQPESGIRISGKEVEEVGFEKIRRQLANLRQLRILLVDTLCVHRPEARKSNTDKTSASDVQDTCPNVFELDLSRNLFERWAEVLDICRQMPLLTDLRSDSNRFTTIEPGLPPQLLQGAPFDRIKTLGLDDTLMGWADVAEICKSLPVLNSLSACGNEYKELEDVQMPASLQAISLERNKLTTLSAISSLSGLKYLQRLSLKDNLISASTNPEDQTKLSELAAFPPSLSDLDIAYNAVADWRFIDQLDTMFPGLISLRVSHNPLYDDLKSAQGNPMTPEDGYMLTIARLGRLERLNYSVINPKERLNSEIYYLSQIKQELSLASPSTTHATVLSQHARYNELCRKYNDVPPSHHSPTSAKPKLDPQSLAANLITVTMTLDPSIPTARAEETSSTTKETQWTRRIPKSCTIYTLQGLIGKRFELPPMQLRLIWETGEEDVVAAEREESSDEDGNEVGDANDHDAEHQINNAVSKPPLRKLREEALTPRMRSLGTWYDGDCGDGDEHRMVVRVEWDAESVARARTAKAEAGR